MRRSSAIAIVLVFLVGIAGCAPSAAPARESAAPARESAPAAAAPAAPAAAAPDKLTVVMSHRSIGMLPLWLTHDVGLFNKHGLDVTLEFAQGTLATQAMINGDFPVGEVSPSAVVASNLAGADLKMVSASFTKGLYALIAAKDITSTSQLRGKTLAIARFGDSSDTMTRLIVRKMGMDPENDVQLLQVGNSPERYAALVAGGIHATIADPMDVVRAQRDGYNVLADQETLSIDYVGGSTAMRSQLLREQPAVARRYLMAMVEGIHLYKTREDEGVRVASKQLQSDDVEAIRHAIRVFSRTIMPNKPFVTDVGMRPIMEEVAFSNPAARDAPLDRFIDHEPLREIDRSGFIDQLYR